MDWTHISSTTAAVTNRYVVSVDMKVGDYTIANASPAAGAAAFTTITHTTVAVADTLGTIKITGTNLIGQTVTETLTPSAGTTVTGTVAFKSVTKITGAGWVSDGTPDTIVVGTAAGAIVMGSSGMLDSIIVNTTAAAAVTISDSRGTIAVLKASIAEHNYDYDVSCSGYLKIATTSTNDLTVVHSGTIPDYATA